MSKREPNKFLVPIVIAGITAGFFISAYKFVFANLKLSLKREVKNIKNI
ncbi:hypothetical protein [Acinetobacter sp. NS-4]